MFPNTLQISLLCSLMLIGLGLSAQGTRCDDIQPFCAGDDQLVFPNSNAGVTGTIVAEEGPDYGCLELKRYPAWFYLQIEDSGDLEFLIAQTENADGSGELLDVDFVIWGPFNKRDNYCSASILSEENLIDCSYEKDAIEIANITNAKEDEIYVFAVLNYSTLPGYISLEQIEMGENSGSTDCTVLDGVLGHDKVLCSQNETILDAEIDGASGYQWSKFDKNLNDFLTLSGETDSNLKVSESGTYKVLVEDGDGNNDIEDVINIQFYDRPNIQKPAESIAVCQKGNIVDLTQKEQELLVNTNFTEGYEIEYFETQQDIDNDEMIAKPSLYTAEVSETIFVRIRDLFTGCYSEISEIQLNILQLPQMKFPEEIEMCVDASGQFQEELVLGFDYGKNYNYTWLNGNEVISNDFEIYLNQQSVNPEYSLVITEAITGCEVSYSTKLKYVSEPESIEVEILKANFGQNWNVEVRAEPFLGHSSEFEYRLDDGLYTSQNVFNNIEKGVHEVSVREVGGCGGVLKDQFTVIGFDFFFTPNGDGINDRWKVTTDKDYQILNIKLFDRYGNFILEIDPKGEGWDGTADGELLIQNDYWFRLEYISPTTNGKKEFSGHFTLKR
ncbi:T9SS type B sorting domain-containing protein [Zunongwangia endophytica]|uniref:T9SS type B sorting domain-containing protein n=1 Tax=Zunongwangia endophytica TaxID=1808945 RepID=A0ABV8H2Y1_9FLAO|nr:T9SS type B sorting domain-containing protein [Zunongwangia endophytica]MDN3596511.1 T9SS type B sorting domain-containing protein [Zunongwangia endophytica]